MWWPNPTCCCCSIVIYTEQYLLYWNELTKGQINRSEAASRSDRLQALGLRQSTVVLQIKFLHNIFFFVRCFYLHISFCVCFQSFFCESVTRSHQRIGLHTRCDGIGWLWMLMQFNNRANGRDEGMRLPPITRCSFVLLCCDVATANHSDINEISQRNSKPQLEITTCFAINSLSLSLCFVTHWKLCITACFERLLCTKICVFAPSHSLPANDVLIFSRQRQDRRQCSRARLRSSIVHSVNKNTLYFFYLAGKQPDCRTEK